MKAKVRAVLAEREFPDAERLGLDREKALAGFLNAVAMARENREPAAMVAAWREIGNMCGFFALERQTIDVNAAVEEARGRLQVISDEELLRLAAPRTS